jgi:hypothetical protein
MQNAKGHHYKSLNVMLHSLQAGNQTATIVSLCCLKDHDLTTEINQTAIRDIGGLEVLVNLLETNDLKCKVNMNNRMYAATPPFVYLWF